MSIRKINKQDYFSVRTETMPSQTDQVILLDLYQPLITPFGVALYLTLTRIFDHRDQQPMMTHERLFNQMQTDMTSFLNGLALLEGLSLIKTGQRKKGDSQEWVYTLYSPKYPHAFFQDPILSGLLKKYVGEAHHRQLQNFYLAIPSEENFTDVSHSFLETFHPDLNDPTFFVPPNQPLIGRKVGEVRPQFDLTLFHQFFKAQLVKEQYAFSDEEIRLIVHYAALSGIDEKAMADIIAIVLQEQQFKTITFDRVLRLASEERQLPFVRNRKKPNTIRDPKTNLGQKINLMETTNPIDFLRYVQNGTQPTGPDIKLVNDLSLKQGLSFPVINALIDYVLQKKNNTLPRAYVEKIASTLAREQIIHAIDAMDFLMKIAEDYKGKASS